MIKKKTNIKKFKNLSLNEISFDEREINSVLKILKSGWISSGKNVKKFENKFSKYIGTKYGVAVNSGSSANLIALSAVIKKYKIKKGDEVIIPASTFATVAMPIIQLGLIPVYVDISIDDLNIDISEIEKAISNKTKIIMPVHTLGIPAKIREINKIAKKRNIIVIEDCCEAHGSKINHKYVGSLGKISCFSFFVAHHITTGEGGMVLTDDKELRDICISLREFGRINQTEISKNRYYSDDVLKNYDKRYVFNNIGYNLRMTEIAAAIGNEQIKKINRFNKLRVSNTKYLHNFFKKKYKEFFDLPKLKFDGSYSFYTFPIIIKKNISIDRKKLCQYLEKHKIETRPLMAGCLPDQPGLRNQPKKIIGKLKNSRFIRDNLFFIGVHPGLNKGNFKYLFDVLDDFFLINKNKLFSKKNNAGS